ncbi:MAG: GNAT family N-acetyltransferase [Pseudomonadota bacterium]
MVDAQELAAIHVRPAVGSDAGAIAALHSASWRDVYAPLLTGTALPADLEAEHRGLWEKVLAPSAQVRAILVAVDEADRIVGFGATHPDPEDPALDHLAALHTDPALRGAGIGLMLMREVADRLLALGRQRLWCYVLEENLGAKAFYARLGAVEGALETVPLAGGERTVDRRLDFPHHRDLGLKARAQLIARLAPPAAVRVADVAAVVGAPHPAGEAGLAAARVKQRLGTLFGLSDFGVNLLTLAPGVASAPCHRHSHEDEFVYVLEGEVWLTGQGEDRRLVPGDCAGFAAGGPPHALENRSDTPARVLEIGSRRPDRDEVDYPGRDLLVRQQPDGSRRFLRRDGTVIE